MVFLMDKMLFYVPRRFLNFSVRPYLYKNIVSNSISVAIIFIGTMTYLYVLPSEIVTVLLIVSLKLIFDIVIKKTALKID